MRDDILKAGEIAEEETPKSEYIPRRRRPKPIEYENNIFTVGAQM